jgi:DNA-binding response OmpR family regulator
MARILVIDDEDQIRAMLRLALEREGYQVMEAPNGKLAMRLQTENPADLVITDIVMPEQEGIETIIGLHREFPATKIIAISGGGNIGPANYLIMAKKLGAHHALCKPFGHDELVSAVRDLLSR